VSFLNQLKSQASALQQQQGEDTVRLEANAKATEAACRTAWLYVSELAKQLNVIAPAGPTLSLDGKTQWPTMKLASFAADARKKKLRDQEVFDYIALGWKIVPAMGQPIGGSVSANFPPDLQRIESRIIAGNVKHERVNVRHPEKNTLKEIRFDYVTESRGSVTITADHDEARLSFRLGCLSGFQVVNASYAANQIHASVLDELAKLIVGESSTFV
jgi:hypothetical protein